jgi:hypothetical protein
MKLQLLCFSVLKACVRYDSMRSLCQSLKMIFAKYLTVTCLFSLSLSFSLTLCLSVISLSVCPSLSWNLSPSGLSYLFGPAELGPKIRPVQAPAFSLFSISPSPNPTFELGLRPDPALINVYFGLPKQVDDFRVIVSSAFSNFCSPVTFFSNLLLRNFTRMSKSLAAAVFFLAGFGIVFAPPPTRPQDAPSDQPSKKVNLYFSHCIKFSNV